MISNRQYKRWTEREVKGKRARMEQDSFTAQFKIPKGTIVKITHKYKGYSVESEPCDHCGVSIRANRVEPYMLTMIE